MRGVLCVNFLDHLRSRCARTSSSFMAAAVPPDLTLDKAIIFQELDSALNATILTSLLCGVYTIHSSRCRDLIISAPRLIHWNSCRHVVEYLLVGMLLSTALYKLK